MLFHRSTYTVWRICGRCDGSGQNKCRPVCYQCDGEGKRRFEVLAHELTHNDLVRMGDMDLLSVATEIRALQDHNRRARIASESFRWEDERKTIHISTAKGNVEIPIVDLQKSEKQVEYPTQSKDPRVWKRAMIKADKLERESGESRVLGKRSDSLRSQRLVA